ncbi:MAG: pantetheine-phosphate adenylyltransferase [Bacteroidetes bacterium]|jgi:pantetheine-phosphate adenylyltransferase|nr:pantetheine-phosphate adenylyltransferase [Bacteroidota bacterium]
MTEYALYPGSFDPITLGHTDVIARCVPFFDKIYIGVGTNTSKQYLYTLPQRMAMLQAIYAHNEKVEVVSFNRLTVDLCRELGCRIIIRGVRSTTDMEYERAIAETNKMLYPEAETMLLFSSPSVSNISSTIVRELIRNRANVGQFLPPEIMHLVYPK